jgi:hypothetical protein
MGFDLHLQDFTFGHTAESTAKAPRPV